MKIFEMKTISSLGDVSKEDLICFGNFKEEIWIKLSFDKKNLVYGWVEEITKTFLKGGLYIVINSPFKILSQYVSPLDFLKKKGLIKHRFAFSLRKQYSTLKGKNRWNFYFNAVKYPMNDKCEIEGG